MKTLTIYFQKALLAFCILPMLSISGQIPIDKRGILSGNQSRQYLAEQQIRHLKEGVLLVRLESRDATIEGLKERGQLETAAEFEQKIKLQNAETITAFQNGFDFCPVFFFHARESDAIKERNWADVDIITAQGDTVFPFAEGPRNFLAAAFSQTDVGKEETFYLHYVKDGEWHIEIHKVPQEAAVSFNALIMMSNQLVELSSPFPHYVRTFNNLLFSRKPQKAVQKLNKRLHKYADARL